MTEINEALRLQPKNPNFLTSLADVHHEKGEIDRALALYAEALALDPTVSSSYGGRGFIWSRIGEYDRAMADYDEAIRLDPKANRTLSARGDLWRQKGDLVRALRDIDQSLKLNPNDVIGYLYRGDALRYKGDFKAALAAYDNLLKRAPDDIPGLTSVGLTYEKMGDLTRAKEAFNAAVASKSQERANINNSSLETARARLAALDSGALQPAIPAAPSKAASATSIPTPAAIVPTVAPNTVVQQGRRIALVIGNSAYKNVPALPNPKRDAEAIAASLRAVGFEEVTLVSDSDRGRLLDTLKTFANNAEKADWAVVYYAGHGMEVSGVNYLIPIEAKVAVDRDVQYEAVPLDQVMTAVEGAKKLRLVLLDACRDNPFASQMQKTAAVQPLSSAAKGSGGTRTRSVSRGLSEVKVSGATLVVYAAKHGQTALDGEGGNSPFAVAFAQRIATPNVEINKLFRLVRDDVMEATAGRQEPYTYGSLPGREDFFFLAK
jgi:tetratricopeptide (TPR) repeat protein